MADTFWGEQSPTDRTLQSTEDPTAVLMSAEVLTPDWVKMPDGSPRGLSGARLRIVGTDVLSCPKCFTSSPWHDVGEHQGMDIVVIQCQGGCGWLICELPKEV